MTTKHGEWLHCWIYDIASCCMYENNDNSTIVAIGSYPKVVGIYAQSSSFIFLRTFVQLPNELYISCITVGN